MLPTKFQVNWHFGSGEEAKIRFSSWQPRQPSWNIRSDRFSYFWSTSNPCASYQVSSQWAFWFIRRSEKWQASWISHWKDFSCFWSTSDPDASYQVSSQLEKEFDRVPRKVIWWVLRKPGVEECIVRLVQGMYVNAQSRVRVGEGYSEEYEVKVSVHQGSVLSPLLFTIQLEALSREFHLYADYLVIVAESLEECVRRLLTWKAAMEKKGLRVNAGKTKIMICCTGLDLLQSSGEFPCAVCHTGVGIKSIFCNGCKHWVHKKCSGLMHLTKDSDYRCTWCQGTAHPLDSRPQKEVQVGLDKLEVPWRPALSSRWL